MSLSTKRIDVFLVTLNSVMGYSYICVDFPVLGVDTILKQNMSQFVRMPKFNNKVNPGIFDTETVAKIPAAQLFDDVTRSEGILSVP